MQLFKNEKIRTQIVRKLLLSVLVLFIIMVAFVLWLKMMMWHILN
ncbi:hypothetical protein ACTHGU_08750 [Chitinophagaceae bacterium MMS25-I14]